MTEIRSSRVYASTSEVESYGLLYDALRSSPIPRSELLGNLELFLTPPSLGRILFMHHLYQLALPIHGDIMEFGVRWGRNLALLSAMGTIYEPFNYSRRILGFDTFEGFPHISAKDGLGENAEPSQLNVTNDYEAILSMILLAHERLRPRPEFSRFELIKGDIIRTLPDYLQKHPETVIAFAYFDLDLYEPTRLALELIQPHLVQGSVLGFDEINLVEFPGETIAFREILGRPALRRLPFGGWRSYCIIE